MPDLPSNAMLVRALKRKAKFPIYVTLGWNRQAGDGVIVKSTSPNGRNIINEAEGNSGRNNYIRVSITRCAARYLDVSPTDAVIAQPIDIKCQGLSREHHRNKQECGRGEYAALWCCCSSGRWKILSYS